MFSAIFCLFMVFFATQPLHFIVRTYSCIELFLYPYKPYNQQYQYIFYVNLFSFIIGYFFYMHGALIVICLLFLLIPIFTENVDGFLPWLVYVLALPLLCLNLYYVATSKYPHDNICYDLT